MASGPVPAGRGRRRRGIRLGAHRAEGAPAGSRARRATGHGARPADGCLRAPQPGGRHPQPAQSAARRRHPRGAGRPGPGRCLRRGLEVRGAASPAGSGADVGHVSELLSPSRIGRVGGLRGSGGVRRSRSGAGRSGGRTWARRPFPTVGQLLAFGVLAGVLLAASAFVVLPAVYGEQFSAAALPAAVISLGLVAEPAAGVASGFLLGSGRPGLNSLVLGGGFAVTLVLDLLLIPRHGSLGAAWASAVAYLTTDVLLIRRLETTFTGAVMSGRVPHALRAAAARGSARPRPVLGRLHGGRGSAGSARPDARAVHPAASVRRPGRGRRRPARHRLGRDRPARGLAQGPVALRGGARHGHPARRPPGRRPE